MPLEHRSGPFGVACAHQQPGSREEPLMPQPVSIGGRALGCVQRQIGGGIGAALRKGGRRAGPQELRQLLILSLDAQRQVARPLLGVGDRLG
jgi:hypothetical protein